MMYHRDIDSAVAIEVIECSPPARPAARKETAGLRAQAPKRVAIRFNPKRIASWDHRKLGGVY